MQTLSLLEIKTKMLLDLGLWKIIKATHSTATTGDAIQDRTDHREKIKSLISFKNKLNDAYEVQKQFCNGVDPIDSEVKVQDFLSKMDPTRYKKYTDHLKKMSR